MKVFFDTRIASSTTIKISYKITNRQKKANESVIGLKVFINIQIDVYPNFVSEFIRRVHPHTHKYIHQLKFKIRQICN